MPEVRHGQGRQVIGYFRETEHSAWNFDLLYTMKCYVGLPSQGHNKAGF